MNVMGKIRRLRYRDGLSIKEICRRTGLARNTVRYWLRAGDGVEPKYARKAREKTILTPYKDRLKQWLEADARRAKRERRTALALCGQLRALGFTGSYARVSAYVRRWRHDGAKALKAAFVPLKFEFGEAFQFDWSEESLVIGGFHRKLLVAHTKLCASRAFLLTAYPTQSHEMLFDAHTRAFRVFGGIPKRGIYDNMKTAVDKVGVESGGSSTRALPLWPRITCSTPISATSPPAGRKVSLRRTCRTAGGGSCNAANVRSKASRHSMSARIPVPGAVVGTAVPRDRASERCRCPEHGARHADADGGGLRRLRRNDRQRLEHLPGEHRAQQYRCRAPLPTRS